MNFDQQLVIGIVFIVAGIAVALLAYAAYLNREQRSEEEQPESDAPEVAPEAVDDVERAPANSSAAPQAEPTATKAPGSSPAATKQQGPELEPSPEPVKPEKPTPAAASRVPRASEPVGPDREETPPVRLKRNPDSGRLNVEVGDRVYRSIEDLRASPDWAKVDDLFSDVLAWLIKEQPSVEDLGPLEESPPPDQPLTMVEQINQILKEKLEERQEGPQAVRLLAGSGGTIRVYIGMDSYPIDEVPDEQVQAIIQQAVKEWEARQ